MDLSFDAYFEWLIPWEGSSYENDPADPGGATKYGIDQRSHPTVNIRTLTKIQAQRIYWDSYWRTVAAPLLPPKTAWAVMDCAVNCGRAQAVKWLQRFLRVTDDGIIGPNTIASASTENDTVMALAVLAQREVHYRVLAKRGRFAKFLKGWLNRNDNLKQTLVNS